MAVRLASALAVVAMSVPSTATNDDAMALHAMQAADDGHHEESQLLPSPPPSPSPSALQTAVFTGGCFFKLHAAFAKVEGVSSVQMGYVGGWLRRPTQIAVQRGGSGHAEGVSLQYNASVVSFDTLLGTFFAAHDGTSLYKQGGDIGAQFRSAVWAQSTKQLKVARSKRDEMNTDRMPPIATSVNDCRPVQERPKSADPVSCEPQSFQAVEHSTLRYHCSDAVANTGILFDPAPYLDKYHKFTPAELAQINETATPKQTHTEEDKHADNGADKSDKVEEGKVEEKAAKKEGGEEEVAKKGKADQKGDEEVAKPKASKGDTGEAKAKGDGDEAPKLKAVVKTVGEADGKAHVEKTHQEAEVKETAHKAADSDEEVPRKKKTKKRKVHDDEEEETVRTTKRRTDDDDDDDDDDDAPKRKRRKRVTSDDDDDTPKKKKKKVYDDVDEEEKPKKKKKKRVRRDDDDDDTERQVKTKSSRSDDDEEAPKPKASLKHAKDTSDDDDEAKVKSKRKSKRDDTDDAQENRAPVKKPSRSAEADESNTKADQKGDEEVAKKGKADQKGDEEVVKPKASKGDTGEAKAKGDGDEAPKLKAVVKTVGEADGKAGVEKTRQEAEVKDTAHKAAAEGGSKASQGGGEKAKEAPVKQAAGEEMHADSAKQGEADSAKKSAEAKEDALLEARAKRRSAEDVEEEMIVRGQAATAGKDRPGAVVEDSKADDAAVADAESKQKGDKGDKTPPLTRKTSSHDDVMLDDGRMAWNNSAEAARYASQYPNFKNPYTQHDVPPPQKKTFYPQTGQPHSTHQQPSYHSTAHGAHGAQGTHDPGRYYPEQTPPQQHTYASSASMSSNYSYRSSAAAGGTPLPAPGYARDTGAGAYPSYGHASSSQQREPEPHHAQPFEREREPYHMHQGSREPERHHQQHQHQHPPQQHHQQHQQQQQPQYQPQQVPSPRDAGGVKEEDHVPATSPMVSPRPVVITCPFEKLGKVMAEVDSIRVRFERNSFTSLTHSDSLTDDSILKTRKSYDESLMRCMLQLDAIEAVGDDRDKIKAERRSVIANIQKLQSCLEDFVERERTLRELENTQSIS